MFGSAVDAGGRKVGPERARGDARGDRGGRRVSHAPSVVGLGGGDGVVDDACWDVNSGGGDGVSELHGVVDLADEEAAARALEQIDGEDRLGVEVVVAAGAVGDGADGAGAEVGQVGSDGEIGSLAAARGVGDPVWALSGDGGDGSLAEHEDAEVSVGLVDVLLDVENAVLEPPERGLVLDDGLGRVAVVEAGDETAPGADGGLEDGGVAEGLDRGEGGFGLESNPDGGGGNAVAGELEGGEELVAAGFDDAARIQHGDAEGLEERRGGDGLGLADAAFDRQVEALPWRGVVDVEDLGADVEDLVIDASAFEFVDQEAFFDADSGGQECDAHGWVVLVGVCVKGGGFGLR